MNFSRLGMQVRVLSGDWDAQVASADAIAAMFEAVGNQAGAVRAAIGELTKQPTTYWTDFATKVGVTDKAWLDFAKTLDRIRPGAALTTQRMGELTAGIILQISEMDKAGKGTVEYTEGMRVLNGFLAELVALQDEGATGLDVLIERLKAMGATMEQETPSVKGLAGAIAELSKTVKVTAVTALTDMRDSMTETFRTFFDGIADMKTTNEQLAVDYAKTLQGIADTEAETIAAAQEKRDEDLEELRDSLAEGNITREQYFADAAAIEEAYTAEVLAAQKKRDESKQTELIAYEQQKIGIDDILSDMLHSFLKAAREELTLEAAKWSVIAIAKGLALDLVGALSAAGAAAAYLAGAGGLALAGFETGGVVSGAMGEPQLVVAHGGETIIPAGGSAMDYQAMSNAVALGVYDAMTQVQRESPGREIVIEMDKTRLARVMAPALNDEYRRLGLAGVT